MMTAFGFFSLPPICKEIQIESSSGMCPFIVAHDDMTTTAMEALGVTINRTAELIVEYLSQVSPESGVH